ncbi:hypothetical protein ACHMWN_00265 [Pedobacter sp. UC225_61]|uniref:hypothetical protein n=1 Tax=Pedobacter sp. UC225_61 TaxID=3374623 RepID=UPI0037BB8435
MTTKDILDNTGKKIDNVVTKQDTSYIVHVFQKGSKNGLSYHLDSFKEEKGIVFNIDSLLQTLGLDKQNMLLLNLDLGKPDKVIKEKNVVIEKFSFTKKSASDPDSAYRYYDRRLRNVDFSFSERLDKQKNSKLVKTLFIYNQTSGIDGPKKYTIPRRVMGTSMARVNLNVDRIKEVFEKFRKEIEK